MGTPPKNVQLSAADQLARLKQLVTHLMDTWPLVLRRLTILKTMGRNDELRHALEQTYAAHVHNTIQDVLIIDLIREIGALVLDDDKRSASVRRAVAILRNDAVVNELEAEYRIVPPTPRMFDGDQLSRDQRHTLEEQFRDRERARGTEEFRRLRIRLEQDVEATLKSEIGEKILTARNKAVAHYDIVRDGADWRMWRVGDTALTYGDIDAYVDACTSAIDTLNLLVRRASFHFAGSNENAERYASEYVDALVIGLRTQRHAMEDQRERLRMRFEEPEH